MYAERAILALELELTVLAMVEVWKPLQAEATENGVVARADQHRPAQGKIHLRKRLLKVSWYLNRKCLAVACWLAWVMGWHRHDE